MTNVFFAAAVHTSNIYPKIQRSGKLRVGIKEGGISFSLSPDSFERRCSEDPEGKHQVFLPRPFSIKTDPSILEFPFFRERKREREREKKTEIGKATDR